MTKKSATKRRQLLLPMNDASVRVPLARRSELLDALAELLVSVATSRAAAQEIAAESPDDVDEDHR